jgi:hypothetical protein
MLSPPEFPWELTKLGSRPSNVVALYLYLCRVCSHYCKNPVEHTLLSGSPTIRELQRYRSFLGADKPTQFVFKILAHFEDGSGARGRGCNDLDVLKWCMLNCKEFVDEFTLNYIKWKGWQHD